MHQLLFKLFDDKYKGSLVQSQFVDFIPLINESYREEGREFVNLFDTTAYITAGEADLDFQLFSRVFKNQKVQNSELASDLSTIFLHHLLKCYFVFTFTFTADIQTFQTNRF